MKLLDNLYTITSDATIENGHEFDIRINPEHFIYRAHFPGEPITPGVCIMQIAVELVEVFLRTPVQIKCVKNIKFLKIISPDEVTSVKYILNKVTKEDEALKVQVTVTSDTDVYAKLILLCKEN